MKIIKNIFKKQILPWTIGLGSALIIMFIFEYTNSRLFPILPNLDRRSFDQMQNYVMHLPWYQFILIIAWWIVASFSAGWIITLISQEKKYRISLTVGMILTLLAILNSLSLAHPLWFNIVSLPDFLIFTYLGYYYKRYF